MDEKTEKEIARLSDELAQSNKRIYQLEMELREQPVLSPSGPPVEQRALKLLQYLEKHGRLTSKQAKQLLQCHPSGVHRAMHLLSDRFDEVTIRIKSGMLVLESEYALRTLRSGAQVELRNLL